MSISDEKLASLAVGPTPEQENILLQMTGNEEAIEGALQHLRDVSDMAQELLAYREAERKTNSWKDAPDWANFIAMDDDGSQTYYECKPEPVLAGWWYAEKGRTESFLVRDWQSTLQERQKRGHYDQGIIDDIPFEERPK